MDGPSEIAGKFFTSGRHGSYNSAIQRGPLGRVGMSRYAVEQCAIAGRETRACREEEIFFSVPRFHKCCLHCEMMDASNEVHKMFRSMAVPIIFNNWRREKKKEKKE